VADLSKAVVEFGDDLHVKKVQMGVGEAILRLVHVEIIKSGGYYKAPEELLAEREMIVEALNQYKLNLDFGCAVDNVQEDVNIFQQSAATSCCRIVYDDTSRKSAAAKKPRSSRTKTRG